MSTCPYRYTMDGLKKKKQIQTKQQQQQNIWKDSQSYMHTQSIGWLNANILKLNDNWVNTEQQESRLRIKKKRTQTCSSCQSKYCLRKKVRQLLNLNVCSFMYISLRNTINFTFFTSKLLFQKKSKKKTTVQKEQQNVGHCSRILFDLFLLLLFSLQRFLCGVNPVTFGTRKWALRCANFSTI